MKDIQMFLSPLFNYFDDIQPAKADPYIERQMVNRAYALPSNFSYEEIIKGVHDLVHVSKHYFVADGPVPN